MATNSDERRDEVGCFMVEVLAGFGMSEDD
jgi:hypothetical protein